MRNECHFGKFRLFLMNSFWQKLKQMEKQNGGRWAATGRKGKSEEKEDSEGRHEFADEDRFAVFGESR